MPDELPLRRYVSANLVALAPSGAALAILYGMGALAGRHALAALLGIALVTAILVHRYLGSLSRFARFVSELSGEQEPVMPRLRFAPATEELATAAATLAAGWRLSGPSEREVVAQARRLPRAAADGSLALIVLHDTTALRRAERMRADFVANASHELKTPIAGITGLIETLLGPARDDAAARERFLGIMAEQADRMRRLVDDLLMLSRIEQHEHARPDTPVDLGRVLESVRDLLQLKASSRKVAIELLIDPALPQAIGDADELTVVFQNLVDNALKYARPATTVKVAARPLGAERLAIAVSDEGDGIPAAHLPRLTERFYRVDNARSRQLGGTGLGLAIVKHLARLHGGEVSVTSELGVGTTFTIELPTV